MQQRWGDQHVGMFANLFQTFSRLGCALQAVIGLLVGTVGIALLLFLLNSIGLISLFGSGVIATPTASPSGGASVAPATSAPATSAPATSAPATSSPASTVPATSTPSPAAATIPPDDNRLVPPEDFTLVSTADGVHTLSWVWPADAELDPTFFRVSVSGQSHDFDFTGASEYEMEVPALCLNNPNFITLDAFNTDVDPEANSQAENLIEADPGC